VLNLFFNSKLVLIYQSQACISKYNAHHYQQELSKVPKPNPHHINYIFLGVELLDVFLKADKRTCEQNWNYHKCILKLRTTPIFYEEN